MSPNFLVIGQVALCNILLVKNRQYKSDKSEPSDESDRGVVVLRHFRIQLTLTLPSPTVTHGNLSGQKCFGLFN